MKLVSGGYLAFYMPQRKNSVEIELRTPTPLKTILDNLQIPLAEVNLVALNGNQVDLEDAIISNTDVVHVVSSVDGG